MSTLQAMRESTRSLEGDSVNFTVQFPEQLPSLSQDEEWCILGYNGHRKRIRFHDYHEIYSVPGFYEYLFYEKLRCESPQTVCSLLEREVNGGPMGVCDLIVLDVGAGNGMVGEQLAQKGVETIVGIDILEEAAEATQRDRPDVYEGYYVVDLTDLPASIREELESQDFNCLTTVAALGFGDIPPLAFAEAYNLISVPGWVAFNIKDRFLSEQDTSGFSRLIRRMVDSRILHIRTCHHYRHRLALDGTPLYYFAIVAEKKAEVPVEWFDELD